MQKVKLFTRGNQLVTTLVMPKFEPMPEVIQWGLRHFVRNENGRYIEAFCYMAVVTVEEYTRKP